MDHPDIGFAFLEDYWNAGYASEATAACMEHAREILGLTAVAAITTPKNLASIAVLAKIGLRDAGMVRLPGATEDVAYFLT